MVNRITASCVIEKGTVYKNERPVFHSEAAGIKDFLTAVYHFTAAGYPKFYKMDHLSKLGWLTAEVLLRDRTGLHAVSPGDIGVVLSNANGSLDTDIKYFETVRYMASPALFVYTLPNIVIGEICIRHHFKGENAFFIADHFDVPFIIEYVSNLLDTDTLQVCLCGWVDVMGEDYRAALFLIEKSADAMYSAANADNDTQRGIEYPRLFTNEIIDKIYYLTNG